MAMQENVCEVCGIEYRYDDEDSPKFTSVVCSQGCWEELKKKHKNKIKNISEEFMKAMALDREYGRLDKVI